MTDPLPLEEDPGVNARRRRTADELRKVQQRLAIAVEAASLGTFYCPIPLGPIEWNEKCKEHFWLPPDAEVDIELFFSILHPDDREPTRRAIEAAIDDHRDYDVEYRTVSPEGRVRWIRAIGRCFWDADGRPERFDGVTLDITRAKEAEQVRSAQQRELEGLSAQLRFLDKLAQAKRDLTDPLDVMRVVTQSVGGYLSVTRCAYAMIDLARGTFHVPGDFTDGCASIVGMHPIAAFGSSIDALREGRVLVLGDVAREVPHEAEAASLIALQIEAMVAVPLIKDGELVAAFAVHHHAPRVWTPLEVQLATEVAERTWNTIERIRAYRLIEAQREQLLAAERAARAEAERAGRIKDEFLATLSHELRTPLSAIVGWSQILAAKVRDPEMAEAVEVIARNARAQTQIIEDLLDMNRIVTGKIRLEIREVDVETVVNAAVETVQPAAAAKGIALFHKVEPGCRLPADAARLQQVLWNLLSNAIKFTGRGGRVEVSASSAGSHVVIAVRDNGEGIAREFVDHVFERFQQADASRTRRHGGLGLGLAIVRQLVELHGGSVTAASEGRGEGATFIVRLPVNSAPAGRAEPDRPDCSSLETRSEPLSIAGGDLKGVRVLVVDDEPDSGEATRRLVSGFGAEARAVNSAAEAFTTLQEWRPDVLVCDIGMPGEDGFSLINRVRALPPERGGRTPAVALTAYVRAEDRVAAINAGFQMHLGKPISAAELLAVVGSLARRK